jgi:hypothetical protein
VGQVSGLVVPEEAAAFQAAQIQQEGGERHPTDSLCDLPPVQQKGSSLGVASIAQEGAGRGTGGTGGGTDGDWACLSIARNRGKMEGKVGKFHWKKGRKEEKKGRERIRQIRQEG